MTEATARSVLLVKALEQNDTKSELISRHLRHEASQQAQAATQTSQPDPPGPPSAEYVARRAELLLGHLQSNHPPVEAILTATSWRRWVTPLVVTAAFILGLATNALGPEKRISIIAIPLLGMIGWNLAVYLLLLLGLLKHGNATRPNLLAGLIRRWASPAWLERQPENGSQPLWRGLRGFSRDWFELSAPLQLARAKRLLHLAATLLAAGTVAGMYWRGLAFEYLAGWESTFLAAEHVGLLMQIILGPASLITGIDLPSVTQIEDMRWPGGKPAALWIHLYAVTAALFICLPRLVLAQLSGKRAARLSRQFPLDLDDLYYRRLRGPNQPLLSDSAWIIPCGLDLHPRQLEALRTFLYELLGLNANIRFEDSIAYGGEDEFLERARSQSDALPNHFLVLFNMAATPEAENQGRLLHGLKSLLGSADRRLVPLLDESSYRRRLTGQAESEQQIDQRRKTWQRLARDHKLPLVTLDLDAPNPDYWYEQLRQVLTEGAPSPA